MYTKMRVWISDEFVIKTWLAWEQTCSSGKVKYVTKIEENPWSSNHGEDDDPQKERMTKHRMLFLHHFAIYEQAFTELYLFSLSFNKKTNSWNIFSSGRIKDNKVFLYCWKHGHQYVFHVLSRGNLFKSFPSFLQPFVSLQQERNFLICGSRYWQNSTALHKLWSLFTLCQ